jgi:hypothetical protein
MDKLVIKSTEKISFEILDSSDESVVFKRVVAAKGRKPKEINKIEMSLPTATVKCFNQEDFENLKRIESEIHESMNIYKSNKNIIDLINKIFDIK